MELEYTAVTPPYSNNTYRKQLLEALAPEFFPYALMYVLVHVVDKRFKYISYLKIILKLKYLPLNLSETPPSYKHYLETPPTGTVPVAMQL